MNNGNNYNNYYNALTNGVEQEANVQPLQNVGENLPTIQPNLANQAITNLSTNGNSTTTLSGASAFRIYPRPENRNI